jgi:hypothetical protein
LTGIDQTHSRLSQKSAICGNCGKETAGMRKETGLKSMQCILVTAFCSTNIQQEPSLIYANHSVW